MADKSKIEWTEASWTPIRARCWEIQNDGSARERIGWHCTHASEGCRNCYAEAINRRLGTGYAFKPGTLRGRPGYHGGGKDRPEVFLDEKMLTQPLRWKRPRMIFVCSMTDLFADFVTDEWLDRIFAVMALCPQHTFQVLTKRPERMRAYMNDDRVAHRIARACVDLWADGKVTPDDDWPVRSIGDEADPDDIVLGQWPLPNVWIGTSVEDQETADARIPELLATPAAVRWISAEPLLGPMRLDRVPATDELAPSTMNVLTGACWPNCTGVAYNARKAHLDWVVVGGESGSKARPFNVTWARDLVSQCQAAGVSAFVKQLGRRPYWDLVNGCGDWPLLTRTTLDGRQIDAITLKDKKGGDWSEWPEDLRVRQFPAVRP